CSGCPGLISAVHPIKERDKQLSANGGRVGYSPAGSLFNMADLQKPLQDVPVPRTVVLVLLAVQSEVLHIALVEAVVCREGLLTDFGELRETSLAEVSCNAFCE